LIGEFPFLDINDDPTIIPNYYGLGNIQNQGNKVLFSVPGNKYVGEILNPDSDFTGLVVPTANKFQVPLSIGSFSLHGLPTRVV